MDRIDYEKFMFDNILRVFAQQEQFWQWLRKLFYLNDKLHKEYDSMYQDVFYIVFYELITTGIEYANKVSSSITDSKNLEKIEFYQELIKGLLEFKSTFTEKELQFIEYKRHCASHIFQDHYENIILQNGKIQTIRKKKRLDIIREELQSILKEHKCDKDFDIYMTNKLYSKIYELYYKLDKIKKQYNKM